MRAVNQKPFLHRRLDQRALARALSLPADVPENLERLQADFLAASRRRAELVARLDAGAASDLPAPSAPWVSRGARFISCISPHQPPFASADGGGETNRPSATHAGKNSCGRAVH